MPTPKTVGGASAPTAARVLLGLLWLCALPALAKDAPRRILIAGDSTAAEYGPERAPQTGWGQALQSWFDPAHWEVRNHAKGGRSARSFIEEGRLDAIDKDLRRGDVLLIQFGHNDAKFEDPSRYDDPQQAYPQYLSRYVALARQRGATPILVTPVSRLIYDFGSLLDTHGVYTTAMKQLAAEQKVALIDLNASSTDWVRALGEQAAKPYFLFVPEQNKADGTHFSRAGATAVACLLVRDWVVLEPALKPQLKRDIDCGAPASAAADRAGQANPSLVVHERDIGKVQPGPHGGAGPTTAYSFFADQPGLSFVLRKRVLADGAGIGLHQHHKDEIYYVVSGRGLYALDGKQYEVGPGDALLTRAGSTHALQQTGTEPLVILLSYPTGQ
ncbi:MAG TPA: cupin domain-containing protein [Stenotrophomonas sp.]|nr:cupin domain-containing protein [Stenotrophomonas sp.]